MPSGTLSLRITRTLLVVFVVLQLAVFLLTALPHRSRDMDPYGLPSPARVIAMVQTVDGTPSSRRATAVDAIDGPLYRVSIGPDLPPDDAYFATRVMPYRAALAGRTVHMTGRHAVFPRLAARNPWAVWFATPIRLSVPLRAGGVLSIESAPSESVRGLLRQRAMLWGFGGIVALVALTLAVRATTRPIVRLARNIRVFAGKLDAPDLPVEGSSEMRELAIAYNEMKGQIASLVAERTRILAAIAHDMRTYLTRLRLRIEFVCDANQRELAAADLDEMAQLLDDTLLFARQRQRPERADLGTTRIADLAEEIAKLAALRLEMGQQVAFRGVQGPAPSTIATLALRRILSNLLDNAARYAARVNIDLEQDGARWRVIVSDDGPGVPAAMLERLGQPFERLDPSRDRATGGAGLGLAIVKALVEEQGGEIAFANAPEGGFRAILWFVRFEQD